MKIIILLIVLLPLTVSVSFHGSPIRVGGCSAILKGCAHMADNAGSAFKGCSSSSPPPTRYVDEPAEPRHFEAPDESPSPTSYEDILHKLAEQTSKSDWNELRNETIKRTKIDVSNYESLPKDSFLHSVKEPHLLIAMPTDASQYKKIYRKQDVSYSAEQELAKFSKKVMDTRNATDFSGGIEHLYKSIDSTDDEFVVVFAHSEDSGRKLVLPNGEILDDSSIHKYCAKQLKVCVVLTCHGDDFDVVGKLTADEGLAMWNAAVNKVVNNSSLPIQEFIYQMRLQRHGMKRNKKVKLFLSASGTVSGTSYYYSSEEK
jgi:hypothetical protein